MQKLIYDFIVLGLSVGLSAFNDKPKFPPEDVYIVTAENGNYILLATPYDPAN